MTDIFLVPGLRTPFVKASTFYANYTGLQLSAPIAAAMNQKAKPDFLVWGQVIPDPTISNIARELVFDLDGRLTGFLTGPSPRTIHRESSLLARLARWNRRLTHG